MTATGDDDTSGRLTRLEEQMRAVTGRLADVEQAVGRPAGSVTQRWPAGGPGAHGAVGGLGAGEPVFLISGQGQLGGGPLAIRQSAGLADVLDPDPDAVAKVFTALASPARITVLRALLDGPRTSQQLRSELDHASDGQLYHHLRELLLAGLITQPARSRYALRRSAVVMLCAQLIAAGRLAANVDPPVPFDEEPPAADPEPGDAEPR